MFDNINIKEELERARQQHHDGELLENVRSILSDSENEHQRIVSNIDSGGTANSFNIDTIESGRIYHIDEIKKVCVNFRLRFLDLQYFKSSVPDAAFIEINRLRKEEDTHISQLKIIAPSRMFELENKDIDPILLAPMGNDRYYFIHQWGNDLAWHKKLLRWPLRSFPNLFYSTLALSAIITMLVPISFLTQEPGVGYWDSARFAFLPWSIVLVGSVVVFYWFALHSKFSDDQWDSKYMN